MMRSFFVCLLIIGVVTGCSSGDEGITFAHLTDTHVDPDSQSEEDLQTVVQDINSRNVDFVVVTGDLTNTGSNAELEAAKDVLDQLDVSYYAVPGNHETNWSESAGLRFNELWGDDRFIFSEGDYLFVGFNTGPYMKMGDGHVKQEDLQWLRRQLEKRKEPDQKLISMAHYPLAEGLDNWTDVTEILHDYDCLMAFCGHGHRLNLLNFDGIPGVMGRSIVVNDSEKPGYTLVTLRNDSAFIREKEVNEPAEKRFDLDLTSPDTLDHIDVSPRPDYSVNDEFPDTRILFDYTDTASIFTGPCPAGDSLMIYGNSLGMVKGVSVPEGDVLWEQEYEGSVFSTPVTNGEVVAFGTVGGDIVGLNVSDGKELWRAEAGTPVLAEGIVEDDNLYIGGGQSAFMKIDMTDGDVIWSFDEIDGLVQGRPTLGQDGVIFGAWDTHLYNVDKETGELNWKWDNGSEVQLYSPGNIAPAIGNEKVFLVAPDRFMTALDLSTGDEVWRTDKHQVRESMGISPDGSQVYAKLMNDYIISVSSKTSNPKTLWTIDAGIDYDHNPCPIAANDDMVVGATKNGLVVAVSPNGEEILWKYKPGNSSVNKLVIDDNNRVWMTLMEGKVLQIKHPLN
ncbi:MAG: PQQ-binding-like beta-propeller repeat protein [Marinilabilia sp.]